MTVPRCRRRIVRDSASARYNLTGLTSRAMAKIYAANRKREVRLARRQRNRGNTTTKPTKANHSQRVARWQKQLGYQPIVDKVAWKSLEELEATDAERLEQAKQRTSSKGFYHPVTGQRVWGPRGNPRQGSSLANTMPMSRPDPITCVTWKSVAAPATGVHPVSQKMGASSENTSEKKLP